MKKVWTINGVKAHSKTGELVTAYAKIMEGDREVLGSSEWLNIDLEDLERIVACVNACAGIPTDELKNGRQP